MHCGQSNISACTHDSALMKTEYCDSDAEEEGVCNSAYAVDINFL